MKALEKGVPTVEQWLSDALPQVRLRLCLYVCGRWPG